jgi:hypothetical protein
MHEEKCEDKKRRSAAIERAERARAFRLTRILNAAGSLPATANARFKLSKLAIASAAPPQI